MPLPGGFLHLERTTTKFKHDPIMSYKKAKSHIESAFDLDD